MLRNVFYQQMSCRKGRNAQVSPFGLKMCLAAQVLLHASRVQVQTVVWPERWEWDLCSIVGRAITFRLFSRRIWSSSSCLRRLSSCSRRFFSSSCAFSSSSCLVTCPEHSHQVKWSAMMPRQLRQALSLRPDILVPAAFDEVQKMSCILLWEWLPQAASSQVALGP